MYECWKESEPMNLIKSIWNSCRVKMANRSYETKLRYLRQQGAIIGDGTRLICHVSGFGTEPYLVRMGKNCLVSAEAHFYTHDGGVKVLSDLGLFGGERMDIIAPITVGDNVYIGTGASLFPGVTVGDNVVIGAHAVVTHDIPSNSVAVGVPARVIKSVQQYYEDAKSRGRLYPTARMSAEEKRAYYQNLFSE